MSKGRGYFKVTSIRGVPIFVHWSLPAGGVLVSLFGHVDPKEWVYYCVAYTLLVIIHESGHALATVAQGLRVLSVEISGVGGLCHVERPRQVAHSVFIYSAGLIAQAATFLIALAYAQAFGFPKSTFGKACFLTFTVVNLCLFVINLIPHRNAGSGLATDGWVLWRLFLHAFRGQPHPHPPLVVTPFEQAPVFPPETRLLEKPGFRPPDFCHGIEVLNDRTTPMEFVVSVLTKHLGLNRDEAIVKMVEIHNTGGMLVALPSEQRARAVADAISQESRCSGHSFVCRYAGAQQMPIR
jgi:ATP-dependent Clp protease adapter protein ClpS